jgi:hypothetical protein
MTAANIDDAPTATDAAHSPRGFPGFIQVLARQAASVTDGTSESMEQRVVGKAPEVVIGQPILQGRIEEHVH